MRYKTKKYIKKSIQYTLVTLLVFFIYIVAAHQKKLPVVAEHYTGDITRSLTKGFYYNFIKDKSLSTQVTAEKVEGRTLWKILDVIVREPGYLYASQVLDNLEKVFKTLPAKKVNTFLELVSNPFILNWIQKPNSLFADVYKYEFKRQLESLSYVTDYYLLDMNQKTLFSSVKVSIKKVGKRKKKSTLSNKIQQANQEILSLISLVQNKDYYTDENKIILRVKKNDKTIAYLIAKWNVWKFPDLPVVAHLGKGVQGIIIDSQKKVISTTPDSFKAFIDKENKYTGSFGGRNYPLRIISTSKNSATIILSIPAAGFGYYLFKILVYILFVVVAFAVYYMVRKIIQSVNFTSLKDRNIWIEESFQSAIQLNEDTLKSVHKSKQIVERIKEQETKKLDSIAAHLFQIHKKIENVPMQLKDNIVSSNNLSTSENDFDSNIENEKIKTNEKELKKIKDEIIQANATIDEEVTNDAEAEIIDEMLQNEESTQEKIYSAKRNIVELPSQKNDIIQEEQSIETQQSSIQTKTNELWLIPDTSTSLSNPTSTSSNNSADVEIDSINVFVHIEEFSDLEENTVSISKQKLVVENNNSENSTQEKKEKDNLEEMKLIEDDFLLSDSSGILDEF